MQWNRQPFRELHHPIGQQDNFSTRFTGDNSLSQGQGGGEIAVESSRLDGSQDVQCLPPVLAGRNQSIHLTPGGRHEGHTSLVGQIDN